MSLDNYANLKTEIADWLDRDDMTDRIDTLIDLAEVRHKREIRIRDMLCRDTIIVNQQYIDLPSTRFLEAKTFRLLTEPVTVLTGVNLDQMNRRRKDTAQLPTFFTVQEQIELDADPDQSYTGEIIYYDAVRGLSDSVTSNSILSEAPDCYLYAALAAAAPFLMHDERIQMWETLYRNARDEVNMLKRRADHIGPRFARVAGSTP
jgi:hypothetical protein